MKNHQIITETSDEPTRDPAVSALTVDESEKPRSLMLIASTDNDLIDTCYTLFMNHCKGPHGLLFVEHVGAECDPKQNAICILLNTAEPYSEKSLKDMLLGLSAEIYDPGVIDREVFDGEVDD